MINPLNNFVHWFEIPVEDFNRAKTFYESVFGIRMEEVERRNLRYGLFPRKDKGPGGAIVQGGDNQPGHHGALVYFNSEDRLYELLRRVNQSGGAVMTEKRPIDEDGSIYGFYAVFQDTEGNRLGLYSGD